MTVCDCLQSPPLPGEPLAAVQVQEAAHCLVCALADTANRSILAGV